MLRKRRWRMMSTIAVGCLVGIAGTSCGGSGHPVGDMEENGTAVGRLAEDCDALVGPEPWLVLSDDGPPALCFSVGVYQDVRLVNKGTHPVVVGWRGEMVRLAADDWILTGRMGDVAGTGAHSISLEPGPQIKIVVAAPAATPSGNRRLVGSRFGDVDLGMTLLEASEVIGAEVVVDRNLAPGPVCWAAIVEGDPYSPIFTVVEVGSQSERITGIASYYPTARTVGQKDNDASCVA